MIVTYNYAVMNTGNVTLDGIYLNDDNDEDDAVCADVLLVPGASTVCTATHIVTPVEYTAYGSPAAGSGELVNNAIVYGTPVEAEAPVSASDSLTIPFAAPIAYFNVIKDFTDDNTSGVMVHIDCNTGHPLHQEFEIFDAPGSEVTFVVDAYVPGTMSCTITEVPVPSGYTAEYIAGAGHNGVAGSITGGPLACVYEAIVGGTFTCKIINTPDLVEVEVSKVWDIPNPGNVFPQTADITVWCDAVIDGGILDLGTGYYYEKFPGLIGDQTVTSMVRPDFPSSKCWAVESQTPSSAIEITNECGRTQQTARMTVSAGNPASCIIINTVFFEGIPTLNQYGLMILALLMLSVGAVSFRRFA